ncbi:MAG: Asp-tRNA(Asn)/Glu-tRNA(Gln) amidotransferase subunit GatC [Firmicutes bacterium]|nr:Asp-tRNA(Asn)/Glu-tRNA(Gln) amidotransferase subunit GatC [Bacillota bacterium]
MQVLDKEHVRHVAKLARLKIDEQEVEKYENALNQMLSEVDKIEKVEVTTDKGLIAPTDNHDLYFNDEVKNELEKKEVLKACGVKDLEREYIEVPKVIADEDN